MTVSVLLRLVPAALASRRLAGEVELVATGERHVVHDVEELLALVFGDSPAVHPEQALVDERGASLEHRDA